MSYLEINLEKIKHNAEYLKNQLEHKEISIIGITKLVLGNPSIARILTKAGLNYLGDSRIGNIVRMKKAGVKAKFVLIRNPALSEIPLIIKNCDISLNTELFTIKKLSIEALKQNKIHSIIIMVEMGDLREGVMPHDLDKLVEAVLKLENIKLVGIGTNLKCFAGVIPDAEKMRNFSGLANLIQNKYDIEFKFISAGNSANYDWAISASNLGIINNLRLGTAILLGKGGIEEAPIPNLHQDAFTFVAEIVELKEKPYFPNGIVTTNAFGEPSIFKLVKKPKKNYLIKHALLNSGRQDVEEKGLEPIDDVKILGASSDYLVIDLKNYNFKIGDRLKFLIDYEAILKAMTCPFVSKVFI
ncbi:MAG: alanine/ornithine racemase family PLP-dependent enzyme [Candidatus Lokiarchaeota archaeon]|nr:alanine/ornithine racemase family PLP-dependent enzyme [Candidatus Lokiarchaeota archaeon]MBD3341274.1 alanine/ornithine racemase family PLP-dependent enzyme [Candidatus Lokiarchaeota archaeon]